ncbi:MAG: 2-oxoacid ferredoxin oxidoreductase [Kiritimatiellia bacterium]
MKPLDLRKADTTPAWCPGCGNFPILKAFDAALAESGLNPDKTVLVSGIGQAAKLPHYVTPPCNLFNGLHGRALPVATGIKCANHELEVIVTKIQTHGVMSMPFNPLALAIVEGCSLVARTFAGDPEHLKATLLEALRHTEGFVLVDILQPCVTFNKVNTYKWYKKRVQPVTAEHDPYDRMKALALSFQWGDSIPIGIIYRSGRPGFENRQPMLQSGSTNAIFSP